MRGLRGLKCILLSTLLTVAISELAQGQSANLSASDAALLRGLQPVERLLDTEISAYGNVELHTRLFSIRRDIANDVALSLREEAERIKNPLLQRRLKEFANDIDSAPQTGWGSVYYWTEMEAEQDSVLSGVARKMEEFRQLLTTDAQLKASGEVGFLRGISVALNAISLQFEGWGDSDYHMETFALRRDIANAAVHGIRSQLSAIENKVLQLTLKQIADDLEAAPQEGYGNAKYWVEILGFQDEVFSRANDHLTELLESRLSGAYKKEAAAAKKREIAEQRARRKSLLNFLQQNHNPQETYKYLRQAGVTSLETGLWLEILELGRTRLENSLILDRVVATLKLAPQKFRTDSLDALAIALNAKGYTAKFYNQARVSSGESALSTTQLGWKRNALRFRCESLFN